MNNALNCGTCGNACPAGSVCNGGVCGCSAAGQMLCGNACIDVMSDNDHCGGCNRPCNGTCTNGACVSTPGGTVLLPPSIRRMTNAEYDASVQALLGTTKTPSATFPPDARQLAGYTLNDAQRIDPVMAKALDDAGAGAGRRGADQQQAGVRRQLRQPDGGERRELRDDVHQRLRRARRSGGPWRAPRRRICWRVYRIGAASPGTYAEGIDLVIRAILQAPGFLYLTALGAAGSSGTITLTPAGAGEQPVVSRRRGAAGRGAAARR